MGSGHWLTPSRSQARRLRFSVLSLSRPLASLAHSYFSLLIRRRVTYIVGILSSPVARRGRTSCRRERPVRRLTMPSRRLAPLGPSLTLLALVCCLPLIAPPARTAAPPARTITEPPEEPQSYDQQATPVSL